MRKEEGNLKPGDEAQAIINDWERSGFSKSDLVQPKFQKKAISNYQIALGVKVDAKTKAVLNKIVNESIVEIKEDVKIGDIILEVGDKIKVMEAITSIDVDIDLSGISMNQKEYIKYVQRDFNLKGSIAVERGPGGGYPVMELIGKEADLLRFYIDEYGGDEVDFYDIYS